jgi:hypothetical protein
MRVQRSRFKVKIQASMWGHGACKSVRRREVVVIALLALAAVVALAIGVEILLGVNSID